MSGAQKKVECVEFIQVLQATVYVRYPNKKGFFDHDLIVGNHSSSGNYEVDADKNAMNPTQAYFDNQPGDGNAYRFMIDAPNGMRGFAQAGGDKHPGALYVTARVNFVTLMLYNRKIAAMAFWSAWTEYFKKQLTTYGQNPYVYNRLDTWSTPLHKPLVDELVKLISEKYPKQTALNVKDPVYDGS